AYNDGGVLLLEAGTGVGKSFAYLIPALAWARANHERTVVSTNTINLQEQLVGKDLPLLRKALETDDYTPTFALLKGWRNYLCLARLEGAMSGQRTLFEPDKHDELLGLQVTSRGVQRLLGRFERRGKGLVPTLAFELVAEGGEAGQAGLALLRERLLPALSHARQATDALFLRLHGRLEDVPGAQLRLDDEFAVDS